MTTKHLISLLLTCAVLAGCSNSDSEVIPEQDVLLSGFRMEENGEMIADEFRFMFFANDFPYMTSMDPQLCQSYEEYVQLEEDVIYAELMENKFTVGAANEPNPVWETKEPLFTFVNDPDVNWGSILVKLPVGHYSVFALRHKKDGDKRIWNKYGCKHIVISKSKNPQIIKCVLPVDYTFTGRSCGTDYSLGGQDDWTYIWPEK